ncbi:MAG: NUDIX hydrolase [Myxococcota bacterium]|jgi:ADP-ribose pyrophosphatase|nr:NUDIX hydrolase [Myxococcota bacterium]
MSDGHAKAIKSNLILDGKMLKVSVDDLILPNNQACQFEIVRHPGAAVIVPVDNQNRVTLVRQYRYVCDTWMLEVPAGKLDPGEEPEACAKRELLEETGLVAGKLEPLGIIYPTPGFCDEKLWLYLARELTQASQNLDADEILEVKTYTLENAVELALNGDIQDAKTVCALLRAAHCLKY